MTTREFLPVPPLDTATDPIQSPADLRQRWRALMGQLGFGERLLWVGFVGPDRCLYKTLSQVPIGYRPGRGIVDFVVSRLPLVLRGLEPGTTAALLLTRPGSGAVSDIDREWATRLTRAAAEFDVPIEPIFRANDENLVLVEPG
jgi:hypothetical protein